MKWEMRVNPHTVHTRLRVRTGPSTSYRIVNWKYPNQGANVVETRTTNGAIWYRWEGTNYWSCGRTANGTEYLLKMRDLEEKPAPQPEPDPPAPKEPEVDITIPKQVVKTVTATKGSNMGKTTYASWYQPMTFKEGDYNVVSDEIIAKNIAALKHNMDIGYSNKNDIYDAYQTTSSKGYYSSLQKKLHNSFNRNKTAFPDKDLSKTFAYVFFTRPDLNILQKGASANELVLADQVKMDGKYGYVFHNNPWSMKSLVKAGNSSHKFMPFLSNEALSFEVSDTVIKTVEHGETYNGHKIVYGVTDQESMCAGEMSIRYIDTVNLDVFKLHLIWVDYINKVSRGIFAPNSTYLKNHIIDYAASCYYFLCGADGSTILYWQKLTGVFPINTGENTFSWDSGTLLSKPEINIKYMYSFRNPMDLFSLWEFNELSDKNAKGKVTYEELNCMTGSTLSHVPYVESYTDAMGNMFYCLIWKDK